MKKLLLVLFFVPLISFGQTSAEYFNNGLEKMEKRDYKGAITDYTKSIELDSNYADAYINRGIAKNKLRNHSGAIADFTKAIELEPNNTYPYITRGWSKNILKDYYGAIVDFNKAIKLNPNDDDAYYNRGRSKHSLKDYSGAIADYTKAIELSPSSHSYNNRGDAKKNLGIWMVLVVTGEKPSIWEIQMLKNGLLINVTKP